VGKNQVIGGEKWRPDFIEASEHACFCHYL
jgi:hypothetical protein